MEISARGQVTLENRARLKAFAYRCCSDAKGAIKLLLRDGSKSALPLVTLRPVRSLGGLACLLLMLSNSNMFNCLFADYLILLRTRYGFVFSSIFGRVNLRSVSSYVLQTFAFIQLDNLGGLRCIPTVFIFDEYKTLQQKFNSSIVQ